MATDSYPRPGDVFQQRHELGDRPEVLAQEPHVRSGYAHAGCLQGIPETEIDPQGDTYMHSTIGTAVDPKSDGTIAVEWIGFDRTATGTSLLSRWEAPLEPRDKGLWTPPNREVKIMRFEHPGYVSPFVEAFNEMVEDGIDYHDIAFINFGLASAARVLPNSELREDLLNFAYGIDGNLYEERLGTCTTVLAGAVTKATGQIVRVTEPPAPDPTRFKFASKLMPSLSAALMRQFDFTGALGAASGEKEGPEGGAVAQTLFQSVFRTLQRASERIELDSAEVSERKTKVREQLEAIYNGYMENAADHASQQAEFIVNAENLLLMLLGRKDVTRQKVSSQGKVIREELYPSGMDASKTYIASPAMVRRALLKYMFYEPA